MAYKKISRGDSETTHQFLSRVESELNALASSNIIVREVQIETSPTVVDAIVVNSVPVPDVKPRKLKVGEFYRK